MNIIKREQLVKKKWSGGTTTELAIYPQDASYSEMNFKWRLSSAEVQVQESEFTHLPEVDRIIMSLKGSLELSHNRDEWIRLEPFESYSFEGGWRTNSRGKVTDFNLMMRAGTRGRVKAEFLDSGEHIEVCAEEILEKGSSTGVYVVEGKISIDNGDSMNQGDFVLFQENSILRNFGDETAVIVRADIHNY